MNHAEVSGKVRKGRSLDFGVKKEGLTPRADKGTSPTEIPILPTKRGWRILTTRRPPTRNKAVARQTTRCGPERSPDTDWKRSWPLPQTCIGRATKSSPLKVNSMFNKSKHSVFCKAIP